MHLPGVMAVANIILTPVILMLAILFTDFGFSGLSNHPLLEGALAIGTVSVIIAASCVLIFKIFGGELRFKIFVQLLFVPVGFSVIASPLIFPGVVMLIYVFQ